MSTLEEVRSDALLNPVYLAGACDSSYQAPEEGVHQRLGAFLARRIKQGGARIVVNMPPRHGKSRLVAVELPIWAMLVLGAIEVVVATHTLALAETHSRQARDRFSNEMFRHLFSMRLREDSSAIDFWGTKCGSSYKAVGVGGSLTGHGADLLIVDDTLKDPQEARSKTQRDRVWDWLQSTALTRLSPHGSVVLMGTRWHVDDPFGRIEKTQGDVWERISIPAISEDNDWLGRPPGQALDPLRFSAEALSKTREMLSNYFWASLYQQRPVADGGNYVEIDRLVIRDRTELPEGSRLVRFWDLATKEGAANDYTAGALCARTPQGEFWIVEIFADKLAWPKARAKICSLAELDRCPVAVEVIGGFETAWANLREVFPSDIPLERRGAEKDKLTRALPWFSQVNAGKVTICRGPWVSSFLEEAQAFPDTEHDDRVDAVSGAHGYLFPLHPPLPIVAFDGTRRAQVALNRRTREVFA